MAGMVGGLDYDWKRRNYNRYIVKAISRNALKRS